MRGADLLVKALSNAGVEVIFTLSGNQIMPIFDACIDAGIRLVHTRHEGAAVYMAEGYAQLTGKLGVALVTAAPGFGNSLGPLYMARMGEAPVLLLSGDSPRSQDGLGAFQELDQVALSTPVTKLSMRPDHAQNLGTDVALATRTALSGRPGPVHMALPFDLLNEEVENAHLPSGEAFEAHAQPPSEDAVGTLLRALVGAERPLILTGPVQNASRARGALKLLADAVDAPVVALESPRGLRDPSLGVFTEAMGRADVVVSIGKNIDFTTGFGRAPSMSGSCTFLMVDPDTELLDRARRAMGARMVLGVQADAPATVRKLIEAGSGASGRSAWRGEVNAAIGQRTAVALDESTTPMHPARLCQSVQAVLDAADDPILVMDGGEFGQWAQASLSSDIRIINGLSGAIGGGICYAIAAKIARPQSTVVLAMGDGTAGFHFSEFETAARYGANVVALIGHDSKWNAEYQIQLRDYGENRLLECELSDARYDLAAAGLGCHGEFVESAPQLDAALARALESGKPACVSVQIEGVPAPSGH
jgi:acetolactate synthase I/II/III large subunit